MRRDDLTTPFDVEADDLTQEFWGVGHRWASDDHHAASDGRRTHRTQHDPTADPTGSIRAIRAGFAAFRPRTSRAGEIARTRRHGDTAALPVQHGIRHRPESHREETLGELAAGRAIGDHLAHNRSDDDRPSALGAQRRHAGDHADANLVPLSSVQPLAERLGLGAVDPLLARLGGIVAVVVLMVPIVLSLRPDRADSLIDEVLVESPTVAAGTSPDTVVPATSADSAPAGTDGASNRTVGVTEGTATADDSTSTTAAEVTDAAGLDVTDQVGSPTGDRLELAIDSAADAAKVAAAAERIVPNCPQTYRATDGDSWYRIADSAGVTPTALLAENNATLDTVIFPGDDICLPDGASVPTPPTTTAVSTNKEAPTTTAVSTTTAPPTTTTGPVSTSEAAQIIRDVWPDELEERALQIAWRESGYQADAYNGWCCYGLFQIYYSAHASWLDDYGIHQASDLFDARKNAEAAYALYRSAGGWGPWGG